MALQHTLGLPSLVLPSSNCKFEGGTLFVPTNSQTSSVLSSWKLECSYASSISLMKFPSQGSCFRSSTLRAYKTAGSLRSGDGKKKKGQVDMDSDEEDDSSSEKQQDLELMDAEERREWREKIREVIDMNPNVEEEIDNMEKRRMMQKLLADYPLVVDEEDPDWPEDADGWGFNLGQFFDKITIKNKKKDDKDDDDKDDTDNEIVWQDDNYIRPIKDITIAEWEEAVFKDISPLIIFVHNRYKRPKENEKVREELENAVHIIWNCNLPSPRCVAVDAVVECNLVSALQVSTFPEIIFTKAGKILYREKGFVSADELSKIMAFFYYGAAKPPCLNDIGDYQETIPSVSIDA
ncbi:thioredoxin-like fold domain-containing protein MRL7L, chloroplastic [Benincasa hispida]|uniref:thioredoxin-like fold domain-containing protein MRL7L, chloroplastic n=1 Tax=Benincasa hispida TaxID=102211 RepID=UPI0018FF9246|nr:thioredoxin-like fold domain-containing protein MRL7L, chloroplastic [Benincasa hispida]XP_038876052.1 thioredoxin-like fold domain-containing protein MRL7L, chloroplastic [Benincasa hispida]XP_038876053.1 thioredoxin-like fold domain-containing protein MRL7L, chloroplastic [Benincasa hispida]XP_038876054.1 thioredoxin-like fold domain-containing protein MRL7L, chloroplastic [Benincasa hispida]